MATELLAMSRDDLRTADKVAEERGLVLAQRFEHAASGENAVVVVLAACWLLASVIVQALDNLDKEEADPMASVQIVCAQLGRCVADLMAVRQARPN